ncbi:hypothetical protein Vadar_021249 [Vaccinium darrowii]|uniref:Uncharacterized protein n=1 Tax=Vaccinium darrowii TaxID=229202 RepID=A0ACB7YNJ6_9ERIC|nr:hypothetical protein Vadar_021249 [Vaccinium darrowii]
MCLIPSLGVGYHYGHRGSDRDDRKWDKMEMDDSLSIHMDMPGLGKEDVKVVVEQNIDLIVRGETKEEYRKKDSGQKYTNAIYLSKKLYKTDQIKAEMKNGVLKVVVPKVKEEDRPDVFHHVKVE